MTACRHRFLEQGLDPKPNDVYTWWPLSVVSSLAQVSYTVQRVEAQATKNAKTTKYLATSLSTAILFCQIFCFCFGFFGCFVFLVCLVSLFCFRKVLEILRNGRCFEQFRTLSMVSGLFSETALFAGPLKKAN